MFLGLSSRAIQTFSLSDLEEGKISFVHTGASTSRLVFRVSDGSKVSTVKSVLRRTNRSYYLLSHLTSLLYR